MNQKDNTRSKQTKEKIRQALMDLLKCKKFNEIYVREICSVAGINRSSFYEHYQDINDLMLQVEADLSQRMAAFFTDIPSINLQSFINLFELIQANAEFYRAFLIDRAGSYMDVTDFKFFYPKMAKNFGVQTELSDNEIVYHMAFFGGGLNAICKAWLLGGMKETPAQMAAILGREYAQKQKAWFEPAKKRGKENN